MEPLLLKDVSQLKESPFNLISIGMLCDEGSVFHLQRGNSWFTYQGHRFPIEERGGMFIVRLDEVLKAQEIDSIYRSQTAQGYEHEKYVLGTESMCCAASFDLWHERFGHMSHERLKFLYKSGAAEGMAVEGGKWKHDRKCKCSTCMAVNNSRVHVGDVRQFADTITHVGQLVVSDVCGPFPESVEGFKWVVSFTDVYSRFSVCYCLRAKADCEEALKSLIEFYKLHGYVIKEIRSDAGGEFGGGNERATTEADADGASDVGFVFSRVCKDNGIVHVVTPARKPELHGLAENWNRVVFRVANSMLYAARISHVLWACAVAHANYLKNRSPNRHLGGITSYELFYHKRPRVSDLRVWGCDAWELLPAGQVPGQANRRRLIYVGHAPDRIGWRCFDPSTYKYCIRYELIFDEQSAKKRICALREFDRRRALAKKGRLDELPLEADDFDLNDQETTEALDLERRLYPSPLPPPDSDVRSGGGGQARMEVKSGAEAEPGSNGRGKKPAGSTAARHGESTDESSSDSDSSSVSDGEDFVGSPEEDRFQNESRVEGEEVLGPSVRPGRIPTASGSAGADTSKKSSIRAPVQGSAGADEQDKILYEAAAAAGSAGDSTATVSHLTHSMASRSKTASRHQWKTPMQTFTVRFRRVHSRNIVRIRVSIRVVPSGRCVCYQQVDQSKIQRRPRHFANSPLSTTSQSRWWTTPKSAAPRVTNDTSVTSWHRHCGK